VTATAPSPQPAGVGQARAGAWAPLRRPVFRALWTAQVASLIGTWAQTVGAQWFLTTESGRPELVALVQTATSLPVLLLALPAGVLGDLVDRRRLLVTVQTVMAVVAVALAAVTLAGLLTPATLLAFTAAFGLGVALTAPAWQASVPELVPRGELPAAAALNGIAVNAARAVGPAVGGLVVAGAGVGWTFAFNAVSYLAFALALLRWRPDPVRHRHEGERLAGAMRVAVGYVRNAPAMRRVLARAALWVLPGSALWALLPLVAADRLGLGSDGYGVLLGSLGIGAVASVAFLGRVRARLSSSQIVVATGVAYGSATAVVAVGTSTALAVFVLLVAGAAWITLLSTVNATAQLILPAWVRARALATYLLVFQGGQAIGATAWGFLAGATSIEVALLAAAGLTLAGALTVRWVRLPDPALIDPAPSAHWPEPHLLLDPATAEGPVLVVVQYRVAEPDVPAFVEAMEYVARSRRRLGARRWGLHRDGEDPTRFVEIYQAASWSEHLRQHDERLTVADRHREEAVAALTLEPPRASHLFTV
jgi:MFS family permease